MSKSTTIVTTTTVLSAVVGDIRSGAEASGKLPSKQSMLNSLARGISGPKHDWGFLTGATAPVVQKGMPAARLAEISLGSAARAKSAAAALLRADPDMPALEVVARPAALYGRAMSSYIAEQLKGDLVALSEDFSTAGEFDADVQTMFEPTALLRNEDGLQPHVLWGGSPQLIEMTGRAYFAVSSSADVNALVEQTIMTWPEETAGEHYKAFYLPHAVVITPEYPFEALTDLGDYDVDQDHDEEPLTFADHAFQVFIDETLDAAEQAQAKAQAEDLLLRLAVFLRAPHPEWRNIRVL